MTDYNVRRVWGFIPGYMVIPTWLGLGAAWLAWKEPEDWLRALAVFAIVLLAAAAAHRSP
jgi:hypothetical protein